MARDKAAAEARLHPPHRTAHRPTDHTTSRTGRLLVRHVPGASRRAARRRRLVVSIAQRGVVSIALLLVVSIAQRGVSIAQRGVVSIALLIVVSIALLALL